MLRDSNSYKDGYAYNESQIDFRYVRQGNKLAVGDYSVTTSDSYEETEGVTLIPFIMTVSDDELSGKSAAYVDGVLIEIKIEAEFGTNIYEHD